MGKSKNKNNSEFTYRARWVMPHDDINDYKRVSNKRIIEEEMDLLEEEKKIEDIEAHEKEMDEHLGLSSTEKKEICKISDKDGRPRCLLCVGTLAPGEDAICEMCKDFYPVWKTAK